MTTQTKRSIEENAGASRAQTGANSHTVLALEGMTCASCAMRIEKGLKKVPGVRDASVNLATEQATVIHDPVQTSLEQMVQKVEAVGYKALPQKPRLEDATSTRADSLSSPASATQQADEQSNLSIPLPLPL